MGSTRGMNAKFHPGSSVADYTPSFNRAYDLMKEADYASLKDELTEEVEDLIAKTQRIFKSTYALLPQRLIYASEKVYTANESLGLTSDYLRAYYFISEVDSNLELLRRYLREADTADKVKSVKMYCGFYEERLIELENKYNEAFNLIDTNKKTR